MIIRSSPLIMKLLEQPVEPPDEIMAKYSYDKAAEQVYQIIKETT